MFMLVSKSFLHILAALYKSMMNVDDRGLLVDVMMLHIGGVVAVNSYE